MLTAFNSISVSGIRKPRAVVKLEAFNFEFGNFVEQCIFQNCADFAIFKVFTAVLMKIQVFFSRYIAMSAGEQLPVFRRNVLPLSSG